MELLQVVQHAVLAGQDIHKMDLPVSHVIIVLQQLIVHKVQPIQIKLYVVVVFHIIILIPHNQYAQHVSQIVIHVLDQPLEIANHVLLDISKQVQHAQHVLLKHQIQQLLLVQYALMQPHVLLALQDIMHLTENVYPVKLDVPNVLVQVIYAHHVLLDIIYKMVDVSNFNQIA